MILAQILGEWACVSSAAICRHGAHHCARTHEYREPIENTTCHAFFGLPRPSARDGVALSLRLAGASRASHLFQAPSYVSDVSPS